MWKRVFSLALSLILILTAAPFSGVSASAAYAEKGGEVQEALSGAYEQEEEISDAFIEETAEGSGMDSAGDFVMEETPEGDDGLSAGEETGAEAVTGDAADAGSADDFEEGTADAGKSSGDADVSVKETADGVPDGGSEGEVKAGSGELSGDDGSFDDAQDVQEADQEAVFEGGKASVQEASSEEIQDAAEADQEAVSGGGKASAQEASSGGSQDAAEADQEVISEDSGAVGEEEGQEGRIWFDIDDSRIFSDRDYRFDLRAEGIGQPGVDWEVRIEVGHYDENGLAEAYEEGVDYEFAGGTLTLHGGPIRERGRFWFGYRVQALPPGGGAPLCENERHDLQSLEARTEYDFERDRDMLTGWDGSVNGRMNVWVENAENPDGRDETVRVTKVELVGDRPQDSGEGPVVTDFHRDENRTDPDDYWWYYRVGRMGEADLKVTYEDLDGREQSYVFTLRVGGDVYSVFMDSEGLRRSAHPGEEIELIADASHEYYDENGDYRKEKTGLGYIWGFEYGGEYAELEVHGDDPSRATLRFRNLPEGRDQIDEEVRVFVRVLDAGGEDTAAYDSTGIFVRTDYTVVWPLLSCWYLEVGESIEKEKFEVRRYVWGEENYEVLDGSCEISYEWHFDRNALSILRETEDGAVELLDGERTRSNTFTITRKKGWDTGFSVRAVWTDENGDERDSWTNYRFLNKNYDLWFEEHDRQVYTDTAQAPELVLHTDGLGDGWKDRLDLEIVAGRWDDDAWEEVFDPDADPAAWELLEEGGLIRVRLAEQFLAGFRNGDIRVLAEVYPKGAAREEENRIAEADAWFHVREARVEYERENDRDMLTGWDGTVNAFYDVYVENEQYPEGRNEQYRVTEVKVADDRPWDGGAGPVVTDFHRDQNDNNPDKEYWWYYRVENSGEADLEVTYLDLEGREQKYIFTLHVGGDVYSVHMDSEGGERNSLPGGTIELFASASHEYYDEDGEYRNDREGLGYQWSFECGGEYADIELHEDDPSKVTLRFRKLPEGKSRIDEEVRVGVRILNARGEETGGYNSVGFWVCSEYREIWPLMLDTELDVGGTVADRKFEVRSYMLGRDGYEVVDDDYDVRYEWHYDQNALAVTEKRDGESVLIPDGGSGSGAVYSLTRKKDWHTDYSIRAVWTNRSGDEEEVWGNYFFSGRDYEWEIEGGEEQEISDDEEKVFAVDASRLGSFAGDVRFVVNYRAADSREQFEASLSGLPESERPVEGRDYVIGDDGAVYWDMDEGEEYSICPDGRSVMISGDLVERRIRGSLCTDRRFRSEFYIGTALFYEGDNLRGWRWCKVQLNRTGKSVQDLSAENVEMTMFDAPILAVSGAKGSLSFESGDESVVKVGSDGRLTPVSIGTAAVTVRAEKTDNYRPGKTKCLVSVTALDIVHAVLTTGAPAKGYVYDGKAKKPSVKVVYAGRTLTSGTDYTVEYPSDLIKAGKKTVTVRGRGNCTGRAKVSFSITKAAQSVTVVKSSYSKTFGDKAFSLGAKAKTALTYKSANTKVAKVSSKGTVTIVGAGSVKITITAEEGTNYSKAVRNVTVKVAKAAPVIKVKTASGTLKASDLKKAAKNFNPGITVNSKAKMTFKRVSGSKFITVNTGTGVLKVAKNTKAGKYQVKVKITAAAKGNYTSGTKTVTITVKVK